MKLNKLNFLLKASDERAKRVELSFKSNVINQYCDQHFLMLDIDIKKTFRDKY